LQIDHLIACVHAAFDRLLDPIDHCWDIFFRNGATDDLVIDLDPLAFFVRLDGDDRMAVLPAPTRLTDEFTFALGAPGNRLAIRDLRRAGAGIYFEFALQPIDN